LQFIYEFSTILSLPTIGGNIGSIATSAMAGFLAKHGFAGGWPSVFYVSGMKLKSLS
jgi:ACS family sodium-dependent inorganic phosphate cotransporter-like MFS transporter 5